MNEFMEMLQKHEKRVVQISDKIEKGEHYLDDLREYLPALNQMVLSIFMQMDDPQIQLDLNKEFVLQVLNDIVYGIEQEDDVYLLDTLRYGLLEVYSYIDAELQGENSYE